MVQHGNFTHPCLVGLGVSAGRSKEARNEAQNWVRSALQVSVPHSYWPGFSEPSENRLGTDTLTLLGYTVRFCACCDPKRCV